MADLIKVTDIDDNTIYRVTNLKVGNKDIITPIKALDLSKMTSGIKLQKQVHGVNEIYRKVTTEKIKEMMTNKKAQSFFDYSINSAINKSDANSELNVLFLEHEGKDYPDGKILEFISDNVHSFSDIVTLPLITDIENRISDEKTFKEFITFLSRYVEEVEKLNKKPIMGIVPNIPWIFSEDLANFYLKNGINAFCFDFNGKNPLTIERNIRPFLKAIKQEGQEEKSLFYCINANAGKISKGKNIIPAKDILSFGFGFDILGLKHKKLKLPAELFEKIKQKGQRLRLFNKSDYGYYIFEDSKLIKTSNSVPSDSSISAEDIIKRNALQNVFNMEQHGLEAINLRNIIKENSILPYLDKKANIKDKDKNHIKKMKKL